MLICSCWPGRYFWTPTFNGIYHRAPLATRTIGRQELTYAKVLSITCGMRRVVPLRNPGTQAEVELKFVLDLLRLNLGSFLATCIVVSNCCVRLAHSNEVNAQLIPLVCGLGPNTYM